MNDRCLPPLKFLLESSRTSLLSFLLAHRNKSANGKKSLRRLMEECVEEEALALLAEWLNEYGEELLALSAGEKVEVIELDTPKPLIERQATFADWRSSRRHWRKRAG